MLRLSSRQSVCSSCQLPGSPPYSLFIPHSLIRHPQLVNAYWCLVAVDVVAVELLSSLPAALWHYFTCVSAFSFVYFYACHTKAPKPQNHKQTLHIQPHCQSQPLAQPQPQDPHTIEQAALCFGICICCLYPVNRCEEVKLQRKNTLFRVEG